MKQLIVVIGLPGSGKDTQIDLLQGLRKIEVIRIGDLIREQAKTNPSIAQALHSGNLVDYDLVNSIVRQQFESFPDGSIIVSDGFPRDTDQADWMESYASTHDIEISKYILLEISDQESLQRLLRRGREDDTQAIITRRIEVFHELTDEVIDSVRGRDNFASIDATGSTDEILNRLKAALGW